MSCIKTHFDGEDQKGLHSCPQCRKRFTPRPVLVRNTMLADLVEQLKKTGLQAAPADHCYAGPEDVACDFCSGRKLRASKSCLSCVASYCEEHLQPHYDVAPLKKHKLVEPSKKLQENICSVHDEVKKLFCRTDQKSICSLCSVEEHKGHHTVSAAAERTERQRELEGRRQQIQQRVQDTQKDVDLLQQEVEAIDKSADKTVEDSEKMFSEVIRLIQNRRSDVKQQVRSQQQTAVRGVKELQQELQQEITELQRKDAELQQLSHSEDHLFDSPHCSLLLGSDLLLHIRAFFQDETEQLSKHLLTVLHCFLNDLLLQLLLKLFDSPHCSLLLGSDLLLHIRASVLDETDQLSEHLLTVLQCFVSRLIDGLHLLLEQIHILLFVMDSLLDLLPPPLQLSLPFSPFCCR
ncbi:unnamed protein product [Menidia menidia]|uniref:(Atlantic silverside) hypothetical protein n=1 Tax=Menidia menidia TaxID=238744 RepID=A0A8S4BE44_9TELE|nr:unnamed protein product [Menidia menidia]